MRFRPPVLPFRLRRIAALETVKRVEADEKNPCHQTTVSNR